jgi:hypothetical protein
MINESHLIDCHDNSMLIMLLHIMYFVVHIVHLQIIECDVQQLLTHIVVDHVVQRDMADLYILLITCY